ncbi:MAG: metal-dependent hydrolase [archaeon]|nr:metal-dependent hydrolase [archaeon]
MDTLFHFTFSIIVGLALGIHKKHKLKTLIAIAFLSILVDIDHFMGIASRGAFHNIFFVFFIPLGLFFIAYIYENRKSIKYQTYSLLLLVMLTGHLVSDWLYGGTVKLFYPFSTAIYSFPKYTLEATSQFYSPIISGDGIMLTVYALVLLSAVFIEDFIYFFETKHEQIKKALKDTETGLI